MFWQGRRVFITGHTGFKGAWLSLWLQSKGAEVTGFSIDIPTTPSLFESAGIDSGMNSITGDIRDLRQLIDALQNSKPEILIHLAAQSLVRESYQNPIATFSTNVMGTANVLEAIRFVPTINAALIVTSDKCYENREWDWGYRENEAMGGFDPYSSSKGCAEIVTSAYRRSFFTGSGKRSVAIASARAGNVIGGGDWARDRLIPDIVQAFSRGEKAMIRNPESIRPWQHVLDPLHGYISLIEKMITGESSYCDAWNFGPDDCNVGSVSHIAEKMAHLWGDGAGYEIVPDTQVHEARLLKLDSSKARAKLAWRPRLGLVQALGYVTEWYRAFQNGQDMRRFSLGQVSAYESLAAPHKN